jgi:PAS domain S-box-containing protein
VDQLSDGYLLLDPDLTILYLNPAYAGALGGSAVDLLGRPLAEVLRGGIDEPAYRISVAALQSASGQRAEESAGDRWFQLHAQRVPEGVVVTRFDVTPRRQLEASLLQNALHCRNVLAQLPTIHWAVDTDLRITHSFGAGLAAIGVAEGEVSGLTLFEYFGTEDPDFLAIRMHCRALAGERVRYSDTHRGRLYDVLLEPLRAPGDGISGVLGLAHDVTERHAAAEERSRLQEQLLLAQKRESLGLLAVGVAHDFNNLLTAIAGSACLLLRELPPGGALESATLIKKAADRAAGVTRQMLDYAGKSIPSRRVVDLNELLRENLPLLAAASTGPLKTSLADGLPAVYADLVQIQQVVMILLLNAREATAAAEAPVSLATGHSDQLGCPGVYVEVVDEGCGIAPDVKSRIFDPFFTTKGKGRGMGLSRVQGIVHAHGGVVTVRSDPGTGSTFRVVLPAGEETPPPPGRGSH